MFTDFLPDVNIRYNIGWSMIAITVFNIGVNMGVILFFGFFEIKETMLKLRDIFKRFIVRNKT